MAPAPGPNAMAGTKQAITVKILIMFSMQEADHLLANAGIASVRPQCQFVTKMAVRVKKKREKYIVDILNKEYFGVTFPRTSCGICHTFNSVDTHGCVVQEM